MKKLTPSHTNRLKSGFTLVEVIVVTTLFAIVGVGIMSAFVSGMKIWNRAREMNLVNGITLLSIESMAKELRQSIIFPAIGFEGQEESLSFPMSSDGGVSKITYQFDPAEEAVVRFEKSLTTISDEKESDVVTEKRILSADKFSLRYLFFDSENERYEFAETWDKDDGLFSAVEMIIEKDDEIFSKTVWIPLG